MRIYDATGTGAEVELLFNFNVQKASETDLMERKLNVLRPEGNKLSVTLHPFEIKTIRIKKA